MTTDNTDTDRLQQAIEKIVDEDTTDLPLIPTPGADSPGTDSPGKEEPENGKTGDSLPDDAASDNVTADDRTAGDDKGTRDDKGARDDRNKGRRSRHKKDSVPAPVPGTADAPDHANAPVHRWFFTFMCMNIPIIGWIYLLYLAFSKRRTDRRNFARAYLFYKLIFLIVSAVILGLLIWIGLDLLDKLLAYMEML